MNWKTILREHYPQKARWVERYIKFIEHFRKHKRGSDEIGHHILPKAEWPDYKCFRKNPWNEAILTTREHFLANWMIAKIIGKGQWVAFNRMSYDKNGKRINSVLYELSRKHFKEAQGKWIRNKTAVTDGENIFYVEIEEVSTMLIAGCILGNNQKGKNKEKDNFWFHKPGTEVSWRGPMGQEPAGFIRGRPKKGNFNGFDKINRDQEEPANKGMIWITNGEKNEYINKDEKLPPGWKYGVTQKPKDGE